ncbi:LOW QUALITY PROTEIN: cocosin 1-like [Argentina anserina]|uniref:LOW QUALITY PROTEIN: cocosin 1-like n=1 Tax=Argentina anserina TaxID=57926 RepID=UPI0021769466|nr:LOW QUALITY PROTEIN: cocosin 1-like [Potentilla anserina]
MAEMDLTPKSAVAAFEGDDGGYYVWSFPALGEANVGAGKLVLKPSGFALPHYADSAKLGYVLQGEDGVVGMVLPSTSEEVVLKLKKGDVIPVPLGAVSWWFNNGDSADDLVIVFLGETTKAYTPGVFTYFFIAGTQSLLGGFSTDFISKSFNITNDEADEVTKNQKGVLLVKLEDGKTMLPTPFSVLTRKLVHQLNVCATLTEKEFPFLKQAGLSANLIKLEPFAISSPTYTTDSTVQVIYVVGGGGRVQIAGLNGQSVLDAEVTAGQLIVVPRFFMVAKLAGEKGMECVSVITSSRAVLEDLAGKTSVLKALSPEVLRISLNINPELQTLLRSKSN